MHDQVILVLQFRFRMGMETASKMSRRHETTSSSEEDDLVDLLGSNYQVRCL